MKYTMARNMVSDVEMSKHYNELDESGYDHRCGRQGIGFMKKIVIVLLSLILSVSFVPVKAAEAGISLYDYYLTADLPQIYIETENSVSPDDASLIDPDRKAGTVSHLPVYNYINAEISVHDCEGYELENVQARVKIRGNYTSSTPKHPLRIKFDEKQAMCGLNAGHKMKSWVLLAEYVDASLLRNSAALYIANSLYSTTGNYASDFRNVEVYINGEYYGVYLLAEQQQVNKYRIDVPEPEDPENYDPESMTQEGLAALKDGHIGYFIEYDGYYFNEDPFETFSIRYDPVTRPDGETFLPTSTGNGLKESGEDTQRRFGGLGGSGIGDTRETGFTIKSDIYFEEQNEFINKVMQTIWDVLYDAVYTDHRDLTAHPYHTMDGDGNYIDAPSIMTAYDAIASVVDVSSLIDMTIIQELAQDGDLDWSSRFFSIDMSPDGNHLLTYTAPWDFDSAFPTDSDTDSLFVMNDDNPWFVLFCGQDWFWEMLNERWDMAMEAGVFTGVLEMLDNLTRVNADAYQRNREHWSQVMSENGQGVSPGVSSGVSDITQEEAEKSLYSWLQNKIDSFDRLINEMAGKSAGS